MMEREGERQLQLGDGEKPMTGTTILARIVLFLLILPMVLVYVIKIFTE